MNMQFKKRLKIRKNRIRRIIKELNLEKKFCYITMKICNRKTCDVYPCNASITFYNIPISYIKNEEILNIIKNEEVI